MKILTCVKGVGINPIQSRKGVGGKTVAPSQDLHLLVTEQ